MLAGLALNVVAAAVGLAGSSMQPVSPGDLWSQGLLRGSGLVGSLVLLGAGAWGAGQVRRLAGAAPEAEGMAPSEA